MFIIINVVYFLLLEIIAISVCFLWCFTVTLTWKPNFQSPKWVQQISDENLTGIPKSVIQLQDKYLYPARAFLQNIFSSQHQRDNARMLQVQIKLILFWSRT